ncbi:MAG: UvrD-helicase domain-containing protein [Oscillospiraceae bacterium]|nr:UvrD-helicase domain-containing protein [Oscillospiraceae bacterium]
MAEIKWSKNQLQAIEEKNKNILVSAAAGSGKTAVLVERIVQKVIRDKIDIDKLLVVTFTNAAASEIKMRVLEAIYNKLDKDPNNAHLQRQIVLLNRASICTIHSFCLDVIRNNFFEIGVSSNFKVGDSSDLALLKIEAMEDLFEELYEAQDPDFLELINNYATYRTDGNLKDLISKIYEYIQSNPFPQEWLENQVEKFNLKNSLKNDFATTVWGKILLEEITENVESNITELKIILEQLAKDSELLRFYDCILSDVSKLDEVRDILNSWDKAYEVLSKVDFQKWPIDKKCVSSLKEEAKQKRDTVKKSFNKVRDRFMICSSKEANEDIYSMYLNLMRIKDLVVKFGEKYTEKKQEKNIIDFNDIEHYALKILVEQKENAHVPTYVAKNYMNKFKEIAIDEYQDSNLVQETILSAVSNGKNMFMVGDVKQSIYKFRQARPELFIKKYEKYKTKEEFIVTDVKSQGTVEEHDEHGLKRNTNNDEGLKIQLFNNFRSRENVVDFVNIVFESIMSKKLGDINYTKEEYLNYTANFPASNERTNCAGKLSIEIIDTEVGGQRPEDGEDVGAGISDNPEDMGTDDHARPENDILEKPEKVELEARYVAHRIKELLNSNYYIFDKDKGYRRATYKDIVILLRSTKENAPIYEKEILNLDMPVFSDSSESYFKSLEIEVMLNLLKIIDNPMQDIPMVSVLRSNIGGFSDNELLEIGLNKKNITFYEKMLEYTDLYEHSSLCKQKLENFLTQLKNWQVLHQHIPLNEFIWKIYLETGYYNYVCLMPNGNARQANLKFLFEKAKQYEEASFKGLFNFIKFMDNLKKSNSDLSAPKLIGENENVIRIMSIHKSKGLEFPIVFLAGVGKKFNLRDLDETILLHESLGLGPKYINNERKIEYNTLAKEAVRIMLKNDSLSEEMRVLYVALTRSKEKLIITGVSSKVNEKLEQKATLLSANKGNKIDNLLLKNGSSYLDWLELIYLNCNENLSKIMDWRVFNITELNKKFHIKEEVKIKHDLYEVLNTLKIDDSQMEEINHLLLWEYKDILLTKIQSKTSVSAINNMVVVADPEVAVNSVPDKSLISLNNTVEIEKPKFLQGEMPLTRAEIGTVTHLILQKLDFKKEYTLENLKQEIEGFVLKEIITKKENEAIDINKIYEFINSDFAKRIKKSNNIFKEICVYTYIGNILVQGVIDLYFEEDNELVLVDYKTDYIVEAELIINKYKEQLGLYKKALEEATGKKVKAVYLYSIYLNKELEIL